MFSNSFLSNMATKRISDSSTFKHKSLKVLEYGLVEDVVESFIDNKNKTIGVQYYPDLF